MGNKHFRQEELSAGAIIILLLVAAIIGVKLLIILGI